MCVPVGRQAAGRVFMNNPCVRVRACWMKCSLRLYLFGTVPESESAISWLAHLFGQNDRVCNLQRSRFSFLPTVNEQRGIGDFRSSTHLAMTLSLVCNSQLSQNIFPTTQQF